MGGPGPESGRIGPARNRVLGGRLERGDRFPILAQLRQRHRLAGSQRLLQQRGDIQLPGHLRVKEQGSRGRIARGRPGDEATLARAPRGGAAIGLRDMGRAEAQRAAQLSLGPVGVGIHWRRGWARHFSSRSLILLLRPLLRRLVVSPGRAQVEPPARSGRGNRGAQL